MYSSGGTEFVLLPCLQRCQSLASGRWCSTTLSRGAGVHALAPVRMLVLFSRSAMLVFLHEGPAEERDEDHRQPRGHLGETPSDVTERNGKVVLLEQTVEGVEGTLVRSNLVNLVVNNKLLEGLGSGRGAVQGLVAVLRNGRRLVSQRLGDAELDQRRRANGPRVAEDVLLLAVEEAELGRRGRSGDDRDGCLLSLAMKLDETYHEYIRSMPFQQAHRNRNMCCCRQ